MNFKEDTITAIITPPGVGAISVIRVSGKDSISAVDRIFSGTSSLSKAPTHSLKYGKIVTAEGEILDDVVVSVFAPHILIQEKILLRYRAMEIQISHGESQNFCMILG